MRLCTLWIAQQYQWWMVIWFGRVVFQMINRTLITLDVNIVWTLWDQCVIQSITKHCLSPRNLAVTLESGEVFSVYEQLFDLAAIWQEVTSSPSPHSQSGVHKDHCCNLTDLKTWHYLIFFLFHFFSFSSNLSIFLNLHSLTTVSLSQSGKSQNLRVTQYVSVFSKVQIVTSQRCSRESSLCWNKLSKQ